MKFPLAVGLIVAVAQLLPTLFVCWGVYTDQSDAGLAAGLYFSLFGYLPWGGIAAVFPVPLGYLLPGINFQNKLSLMSYIPSIFFATANWFFIGFLIGLAFQSRGIGFKKRI